MNRYNEKNWTYFYLSALFFARSKKKRNSNRNFLKPSPTLVQGLPRLLTIPLCTYTVAKRSNSINLFLPNLKNRQISDHPTTYCVKVERFMIWEG